MAVTDDDVTIGSSISGGEMQSAINLVQTNPVQTEDIVKVTKVCFMIT